MYICVEKIMNLSEILDENFLGKYTVSRCNALYYSREIGRSRIYRQSYSECGYKGLRLLTYKNKKNAQKECDYINSITDSNYEVVEI